MPILGADLPVDLILKTRDALLAGINASEVFKKFFPQHNFRLVRLVYTGDYTLWGQAQDKSFFEIAKFGMLPMPGCKGVVIFHHVEVKSEFRGKGLGKELLKIRQFAAKEAGYSLALATVQDSNRAEKKCLFSENWTHASAFFNKRTGNLVLLTQKLL